MRLLLVGAGNMGFAMAQGWLEMPGLDVVVLRPRPKKLVGSGYRF
jgi:pyrroline-5-carboxylate reductase